LIIRAREISLAVMFDLDQFITDCRAVGALRVIALVLSLCAMGSLPPPSMAAAQQGYVIKLVAEKKLNQLPAGPLFWQVENFPTLAQAQAAAGETSLAAEVAGKVWLFTLGRMGSSARGGRKVVEIGPVPQVAAPEYLLRINHASGPPGAATPVHTHPGSEAFYVLAGRLSQQTPHGVKHVWVGQSMNGHGADMPMEVSSSGTSDLNALVMFVVDATKPFTSPAEFE
jgi:hypothetical protein